MRMVYNYSLLHSFGTFRIKKKQILSLLKKYCYILYCELAQDSSIIKIN